MVEGKFIGESGEVGLPEIGSSSVEKLEIRGRLVKDCLMTRSLRVKDDLVGTEELGGLKRFG